MLTNEPTALEVVRDKAVSAVDFIFKDNRMNVRVTQSGDGISAGRNDHDALNPLGTQQVDVTCFAGCVQIGIAEDDRVAVRVTDVLDDAGNLAVEWVGGVGHD